MRNENLICTVLSGKAQAVVDKLNNNRKKIEIERLGIRYISVPANGVMTGCSRIVCITEKEN